MAKMDSKALARIADARRRRKGESRPKLDTRGGKIETDVNLEALNRRRDVLHRIGKGHLEAVKHSGVEFELSSEAFQITCKICNWKHNMLNDNPTGKSIYV